MTTLLERAIGEHVRKTHQGEQLQLNLVFGAYGGPPRKVWLAAAWCKSCNVLFQQLCDDVASTKVVLVQPASKWKGS